MVILIQYRWSHYIFDDNSESTTTKMSNEYSCAFIHPARILIFGPSYSGKSTLVSKLLDNQLQAFDLTFDRIIYCSDGSSLNTKENQLPIENYEYFDKNLFESLDSKQNNCIILDDFMHRASNDVQISELFTKRSHHQNVTIIFLLQNLFPKSKYMSDIKRNANYIILMSNPADEKSIKLFSSYLDPSNPNFIHNAYIDSTKNKPFSYLLVDLHQQQSNEVRIRTNLTFDGKPEQTVYVKIQEYPELCKRIGCSYKKEEY